MRQSCYHQSPAGAAFGGYGQSGFAGAQNPLFFKGNTSMLSGDARQRVDDILKTLN